MHYTNYVLIPSNTEDIWNEVDLLMEPYWEDTEGEEHEEPCECVTDQYSEELFEITDREFGYTWELKELWKSRVENHTHADPEETWRKMIDEIRKFTDIHADTLIKETTPDPDCEECDGTGQVITRCNPCGYWDWWKWDVETQVIEGEELDKVSSHGRALGEPRTYVLNQLDISRVRLPNAILSPDGWIRNREGNGCGWVEIPDEIWWPRVLDVLNTYRDCLLVPVDCHI